MAGISTIDVQAYVDKLMIGQSRQLENLKIQKIAEDQDMNFFKNFQTVYNNFQNSLTNMSTAFSVISLNATASNSAVSAEVTSNYLNIATHTVNVTQLASAQNEMSATFNSNSALNLNETLTFTSGSKTFNVDIIPNQALTDIAYSINNASGNFGLSATIITSTASDNVTPQYSLVVSANNTGTANQFTISGDILNAFNFTQTNAAEDAIFTFDNLNEVRSSNEITDVVDGLTINLLTSGQSTNITIGEANTNSSNTIADAVSELVTNYNAMLQYLDCASANTDLPIVQNSILKMIIQDTMNNFNYVNASGINTLANLGIQVAPYQTLINPDNHKQYVTSGLMINPVIYQNNMTQLNYVINNQLDALENFFLDLNNGFVAVISSSLNQQITALDNGVVAAAENSITSTLDQLDDEIADEKIRLAQVKDSLIDRYSALNAQLSIYDSMSKALEKQLSYLDSLVIKK